jgi:hypothetical protein
MALSHRGRKLVVAFSGAFKRQSAFGTPLATGDINTRHPQSSPTFPGRTITREEIRDCTGEYVIREDITSRLARLSFSFDADAFLIAGWLAYAMSAAAGPSGSQVPFVWTLAVTGTLTAGSFTISHTNEGITDTVDIPYNATNAELTTLLGTLRTIKPGNFTVAGTALPVGPLTVTGAGKFAAGAVTLPTISNSGLTGGTVAITETTPGTSKTAQITRTTSDQNSLFSLIVGFDGDSTNPDKYRDMIVNTVTVRGALRGKVSVEVETIGSQDLIPVSGYSFPACVNIDPIYTKDCRAVINSAFVTEAMREFSYTYSNNAFTGDDPFPYDDIDIIRLEHGDRTSSFTFSVYGSKGDALYTLAEAETVVAVRLLLGAPVKRTEINAAKTNVKLDDAPITFAGEALRSAMGITGTPLYDSGTAGTPDKVIYYGSESTTFLAT